MSNVPIERCVCQGAPDTNEMEPLPLKYVESLYRNKKNIFFFIASLTYWSGPSGIQFLREFGICSIFYLCPRGLLGLRVFTGVGTINIERFEGMSIKSK